MKELSGLLVGLDAGASKTVCAVADATGQVLGRGKSGPANYLKSGVEAVERTLRKAIGDALRAAGEETDRIAAVCAGVAGARRRSDRRAIKAALGRFLPAPTIRIENDALIALAGATNCRTGVIVVAGTGSIALGVDPDGREVQAGGWGHVAGDEGGAYDLARRAIVAAMRDFDGRGPRTRLRRELESKFSLSRIDQIIPLLYGAELDHAGVAALFPLVDKAAEDGDGVAQRLIEEGAGQLAEMAAAVIARLGDFPMRRVAAAGGAITHSSRLAQAFRRSLTEREARVHFVNPANPPEVGAILLARAALDGRPSFAA